MIKVGIITASDKGAKGEREDLSGKTIEEWVAKIDGAVQAYAIVPDERDQLAEALVEFADRKGCDLIFTTGGTGLSPRDVTPEATLDVIDRLVPGIPEAMRAESLKHTNRAMLTRGIAGTRRQTLIINLPGSPKAVAECLEIILPALPHAVQILKGQTGECARK